MFYTITAYSGNQIIRKLEAWTESVQEVSSKVDLFTKYTAELFTSTAFIVCAEVRNDDNFELVCNYNSTRNLPWTFCIRNALGEFVEWKDFYSAA
jgi:hypothetical protein